MSATPPPRRDAFAAWRYPNFRLLISARFIATLGEQMAIVAVGWQIYRQTNSALALGLVGLVQILPAIFLAPLTGTVADKFSRQRVALYAQIVLAICSVGLAVVAALSLQQEIGAPALLLSRLNNGELGQMPFLLGQPSAASVALLGVIYLCLFGIGVGRAFANPAVSSLLPLSVKTEAMTNAVTWSSNSWQLASVIGPALGGFVIALRSDATPVFVIDAITALLSVFLLTQLRVIQQPNRTTQQFNRKTLSAGFSFIWKNKILLSAITLDMFAVLIGGITALLPIFAEDILEVGPQGLGWMRAMPSIGAILMAMLLVSLPPLKRAGMTLLVAVAGFGVATFIFGLSTNFLLSLAMLFIMGALDNISVVIRGSMMILYTPDEMRGRASAVNSLFIGLSNEMGTFESGVAAYLLGATGAVLFGGIGTIVVVIVVALLFPELRNLGELRAIEEERPPSRQPAKQPA
jgi:MFS family permease